MPFRHAARSRSRGRNRRDRRRRSGPAAGHRRGRAPPSRLPTGVGRHVPLQHGDLDAERVARRVRSEGRRRGLRRRPRLRATRSPVVPQPDRRRDRRPGEPPPLPGHDAEPADVVVVRTRRARGGRPSGQDVDLPVRARDRHRQRAERAGHGRDPADARTTRGPSGRGVAAVGADEPLACDRPRDRRAADQPLRHLVGVLDQRRHVRIRRGRVLLAHYDARNPNPVQGKPLEKVLSARGSRGTTGSSGASSSRCSRSRSCR